MSHGEDVGSLGITGNVGSEIITLRTDIWHQEGTHVTSIKLNVWMPPTETDAAADVASFLR